LNLAQWWAHFECTRINTTPTFLYKKFEEILAREAGATHTINAGDADVARKVLERASGVCVSAPFDFVGAERTLALAVGASRRTGGPGWTRWRRGAHDRAEDPQARGHVLHVVVGEHP
jgi:hypothetical protein